jgi:hypothetical protein
VFGCYIGRTYPDEQALTNWVGCGVFGKVGEVRGMDRRGNGFWCSMHRLRFRKMVGESSGGIYFETGFSGF